jgi:hypothetical protein
VILEEGEDYSLAGGIPALTKAGFQRMAAAHAIGREAAIIVDDRDHPLPSGTADH